MGAVIFVLISSLLFVLIVVLKHRSLKRRAVEEQEQRTGALPSSLNGDN